MSMTTSPVTTSARTYTTLRDSINKWVAESLDSLEKIARRRDVEGFSKESVFASQKMRSRLAASDELAPSAWSASAESSRAAYLRKKPVQGRRSDRPEDDTNR